MFSYVVNLFPKNEFQIQSIGETEMFSSSPITPGCLYLMTLTMQEMCVRLLHSPGCVSAHRSPRFATKKSNLNKSERVSATNLQSAQLHPTCSILFSDWFVALITSDNARHITTHYNGFARATRELLLITLFNEISALFRNVHFNKKKTESSFCSLDEHFPANCLATKFRIKFHEQHL